MHIIAGSNGVAITFRNAREVRSFAEQMDGFAGHAEEDDPERARVYIQYSTTIPQAQDLADELAGAAVSLEEELDTSKRD